MHIEPYLQFNGNCEAALKFYEKTLGGKIEMMMNHRDSPMRETTPPDWRDKIMHARLVVDGKVLMAMDAPPDVYRAPTGFHLSLGVGNAAEAKRIFDALAEGGTVRMPLEKTFWAESFGMLVDRFGIPWMVGTTG